MHDRLVSWSIDALYQCFLVDFQMVLDTLGEEEAMKPKPHGIFTEIASEAK